MRILSIVHRMSVLLTLLILAGGSLAQENTPKERFRAGLAAYEQGDFIQATEHWQSLLDEGWGGGELVFNLGNAWFRRGDTGRAVLNWQRALLLDPLDRDASANLDFIRPALADRFEAPVRLPLWDWLDGLLSRMPTALLAWGSLAFLLAAAGVASSRFFNNDWRMSPALRLLLTVLAVPALAGLLLLFLQDRRFTHHPQAVILAPKVELRAAPSPGATAQFDLHAGTTVVLVRRAEEGGWCEIELPDGRRGWSPPASLEAVDLPLP